MQCPLCNVTLDRVAYEEHAVHHCPQCSGYLAAHRKIRLIKGSRDQSTEALHDELSRQRREDTSAHVNCPKCLSRMTKVQIRLRSGARESFAVDRCKSCRVDWFDGGELARLQLGHESTPKGREELDAQRRSQQRTTEEKERFEALLAALPEEPSLLERFFHDSLAVIVVVVPLVALAACLLFNVLANFPVSITIAVSLLSGAALIWFAWHTAETAGRNLLLLTAIVAFIEALWIGFLVHFFG